MNLIELIVDIVSTNGKISFEQEIGQVRITLSRNDKSNQQVLPIDHIVEDRLVECISFMETKIKL